MDSPINSKTALLLALIHGEGFGLALIERVKELTSGEVSLHQGSVYPALRALERDGLVVSYKSDPIPERGGRPRRYYKLTAKGLAAAEGQRHGLYALLRALG